MRWVAAGLVAGAVMMIAAAPGAWAQAGGGGAARVGVAGQSAPEADPKAADVRAEFIKVLARYPPEVARVFKVDPSLLSREDYLAQYPAVAEFLKRHPEVRHSPVYYLERVTYPSSYYERQPMDRMFENISIVVVILAVVGGVMWLIRTAIDYRRWGRQAKVQAETHGKLLDRFSGHEELLAYVQSPAGSQFLQSAPIALDSASPRSVGAPLSRILWSMQAGVVLAIAGVGLNIVSRRLEASYIERGYQTGAADPFFALGVVVMAVGIGFLVSAGLAYLLSRRLGLLSEPGKGDAGA
jgi:hypothetical protein